MLLPHPTIYNQIVPRETKHHIFRITNQVRLEACTPSPNTKKARRRISLRQAVDKLVYLKRGGRIGLVSATVADLLKIKPVITCNEDGVY